MDKLAAMKLTMAKEAETESNKGSESRTQTKIEQFKKKIVKGDCSGFKMPVQGLNTEMGLVEVGQNSITFHESRAEKLKK